MMCLCVRDVIDIKEMIQTKLHPFIPLLHTMQR